MNIEQQQVGLQLAQQLVRFRDRPRALKQFVVSSPQQHFEGGGDHWMVIGEVMEVTGGMEPHRPLLFLSGKYRAIDYSEGTAAPDLINVHDEPAHIYYE